MPTVSEKRRLLAEDGSFQGLAEAAPTRQTTSVFSPGG